MTDQPTPTASAPIIEERMHPLSPLVSLWLGVVALGWFVVTSSLQGDPIWQDLDRVRDLFDAVPWWVLVVLAFLLVGLAFGYRAWWTTKFVIDDREFRLENTGAFRESQRIAFSRIQSVDVTQPFAARILGLAQVQIDVGGEGGATLKYLKRARAAEIRDHLMVRAHGGSAATTTEPGRTASAWDDSAPGDEVLVRLGPGEIILSAFATLDILFILLGFAIPWGLGMVFDWPIAAWGGGMVGLGVALLGYLSKRLFGQFNYTLARTPAGLRITRGLFTLRSQTIPTHRVQAVATSQPLLWRWLGRAKLEIAVLGTGTGEDVEELGSSVIYLPFGTAAQVQIALAALWPGLELDRLTFTRSPERAKRLDPLQWSWQGYALDDRVIVARSGWTHRRQVIIPHGRLVSVGVRQGPWARALDLADVHLQTADLLGLNQVHHLDAADARRLAFDELDRARIVRDNERVNDLVTATGGELAGAPMSGAPMAGAPMAGPADVWLPATAPLPARGSLGPVGLQP